MSNSFYNYTDKKEYKGLEAYVYRFALPQLLSHFRLIDNYNYNNKDNIIYLKADEIELQLGSVNKIKGNKNKLSKNTLKVLKEISNKINNFKEE